MVKNHIKRIAAPNTWNLARKAEKFSMKQRPGKKIEYSLPLGYVLRDLLGLALTAKEAQYLVQNKTIEVNGRRVKELRYPIMLMDVVLIKDLAKAFRMSLDGNGKLVMKETEELAKPSKIMGKTTIKSGKTQLNLFDGSNTITEKKDLSVGDSVILGGKGEIKSHIKMESGCQIFLIGGKHVGTTAKLIEVKSETIVFEHGKGKFETSKEYAYPIGKDKAVIHM